MCSQLTLRLILRRCHESVSVCITTMPMFTFTVVSTIAQWRLKLSLRKLEGVGRTAKLQNIVQLYCTVSTALNSGTILLTVIVMTLPGMCSVRRSGDSSSLHFLQLCLSQSVSILQHCSYLPVYCLCLCICILVKLCCCWFTLCPVQHIIELWLFWSENYDFLVCQLNKQNKSTLFHTSAYLISVFCILLSILICVSIVCF